MGRSSEERNKVKIQQNATTVTDLSAAAPTVSNNIMTIPIQPDLPIAMDQNVVAPIISNGGNDGAQKKRKHKKKHKHKHRHHRRHHHDGTRRHKHKHRHKKRRKDKSNQNNANQMETNREND